MTSIVKNIAILGFPSFIMEFTIGMITFVYNLVIVKYGFGEIGLAAYLLIGYLMLIFLTLFLGMIGYLLIVLFSTRFFAIFNPEDIELITFTAPCTAAAACFWLRYDLALPFSQ